MSRPYLHFIAILPMLSVLSLCPWKLDPNAGNRSMASVGRVLPTIVEDIVVDIENDDPEKDKKRLEELKAKIDQLENDIHLSRKDIPKQERDQKFLELESEIKELEKSSLIESKELIIANQQIQTLKTSVEDYDKIKKNSFPKYEENIKKIDISHLKTDGIILSDLSKKNESLKEKVLQLQKDYTLNLEDKDLLEKQKKSLQDLILELVEIEKSYDHLFDQKQIELDQRIIAQNAINELKGILESLLLEEEKLAIALDLEKEKMKKENKEKKLDKIQTEDQKLICKLEDQNKALTKQIEDLMLDHKKIMEQMIDMNQRLQAQPQYSIPSWLMAGSLVNPQFQYPYNASPIIIIANGQNHHSNAINRDSLSETVQPMQQLQRPQMIQHSPSTYIEYDQRFQTPHYVLPGNFSDQSFFFSFGNTNFNQIPASGA